MKVLVTTHAQMFQTPDGNVWTNSIYGYSFFKRYLRVFEDVKLVTRMKQIPFDEVGKRILVSGPNLEFFNLPFYRGPKQFVKQIFKINSLLAKAIESCDCAILRIPDQVSFQLFKKLKKYKIPTALEVVAHPWDLYAPGAIKSIIRPLVRIVWDYNLKKICQEAIGVSYVTAKYIQIRYPSDIKSSHSERFETHYTSADLEDVFFDKPRDKESFVKKTLNFIHVSTISDYSKGHVELLNVFAELKKKDYNFQLTFIGGGTHLNEFITLRNKLGLQSEVEFLGNLSNSKEVADMLKKSDIFIFPSKSEGIPRVLLEAMSSGIPCLATNVGGISELISEEFLVDVNNLCELKEKIIDLYRSPEKLSKESKANFEKVVKCYHPEIITSRRNQFYSKLKQSVRVNDN